MKDQLDSLLLWSVLVAGSLASGAVIAKAVCNLLHY